MYLKDQISKTKNISKIVVVVGLILLSLKVTLAQNIPLRYRKTVVYLSSIDYQGQRQSLGTGFLMATIESNNLFGYLVSAKHVITEPKTNTPYDLIQVTFNKKNKIKDSIIVKLNPAGRSKNVYYHIDPSVDLVVVPLLLDLDSSDISFSYPAELFKSKNDFDTSYIKPGTNLFYTGMFSPYLGYNKNYPITRFGKVALITDEKIQFDQSEPKANLILAETTTFGGNSGSPVFAYGSDYKINSYDSSDLINLKEQNHVSIYMIGIMKGYFQENNPVTFINTNTMTPTYSTNIGIAAIIPSYFLYEILQTPELTSMRKYLSTPHKP